MSAKIKIGIIIDDYLQPAWVVTTLEKIRELGHSHISLVIKADPIIADKASYLYDLYERRSAGVKGVPNAFEVNDISPLLNNITTISSGFAETEGPEHTIDVLLNFSEHKASELYADIPQYGVWRPFFSETHDTKAPGVWEVLERRPVTISGIEVTDRNNNKRVVYQSAALTYHYSIPIHRNSYYWKSTSFIPRVLDQLYRDQQGFLDINIEPYHSVTPKKKYLQTPGNLSVLDALIDPIPGRINTRVRNISEKRDWVVMYDANSYVGKTFAAENFRELKAPAGFFWADPMAVAHEGKHFIFLEEYVYAENKGRICVVEVDSDGNCSAPVTILEAPYHLSYPFVFRKDDTFYMIPESEKNDTVDIYECVEFPYKWKFRKNLLSDIKAVDSTVVFHDNKWWLFTNVKEHLGASFLDELFVFYCEDIINCELKKHTRNPVISDVRSSRPAGPFYSKDGVLYRPSQICAPYYGWGVSVNKVVKLTEDEYEEQNEYSISPDLQQRIAGIHTLSYAGNLCVVDALMDMKK